MKYDYNYSQGSIVFKEFKKVLLEKGLSIYTINFVWRDLRKYYFKNRYYHNLDHLEQLLIELFLYKDKIQDWKTLILALVYHDVIQDPFNSETNEQESVEFMIKQLNSHLSDFQLVKVGVLINATRLHEKVPNNLDFNLFLDADMSIFAKSEEKYIKYMEGIREEYSIYPDSLYKKKRLEFLEKMLNKKHIYITKDLREKYEKTARENISKEIEILKN